MTYIVKQAVSVIVSMFIIYAIIIPSIAQDIVRLQLSWFPTADAGCIYQAQAEGLYVNENLNVIVTSGGPQINNRMLLLSNNVDVTIAAYGHGAINYAESNVPIVLIAPMFQRTPLAFIAVGAREHINKNSVISGPIYLSAHSRSAVWPEIRRRFDLQDNQLRPYTGALEPIIADPKSSILGFVSNEPVRLSAANIPHRVIPIIEYGLEDYGYFLEVRRDWIQSRRDVVQRLVRATMEGCRRYVSGNYRLAHELISRLNRDITISHLEASRAALVEFGIIGDIGKIGKMSRERWNNLIDSAIASGANVDRVKILEHVDFSFLE